MDCPVGYRCLAEPQWSPETWLPLAAIFFGAILLVLVLILVHTYLTRNK
jgi:hypothetical protein